MTKVMVAMLVATSLVALWFGAYRSEVEAAAESESAAQVDAWDPRHDPPESRNTPAALPHPRGLPRRRFETCDRRERR